MKDAFFDSDSCKSMDHDSNGAIKPKQYIRRNISWLFYWITLTNTPANRGQMRPVHITRDKMVHYIYVPEDPHHADLNWMYASTETMFSGRYHLAAGSMFTPAGRSCGR